MGANGPEWVPDPCSTDDQRLKELQEELEKIPNNEIRDMKGFVSAILWYLRGKEKDRVRRIYEQI